MSKIKGKLLKVLPKKGDPNKEKFNLWQYFKESKEELKKVAWPTRKATWRNTWIVIGFSLFLAVFLGVLDFAFNYALEWFLKI